MKLEIEHNCGLFFCPFFDPSGLFLRLGSGSKTFCYIPIQTINFGFGSTPLSFVLKKWNILPFQLIYHTFPICPYHLITCVFPLPDRFCLHFPYNILQINSFKCLIYSQNLDVKNGQNFPETDRPPDKSTTRRFNPDLKKYFSRIRCHIETK